MWSKADVSAVVYELVEDGEKQQELLDVVQGMSAEALETLPPQEMHDAKQLVLRRVLRLQSAGNPHVPACLPPCLRVCVPAACDC